MNTRKYVPSDPDGVFGGALYEETDPALSSGLLSSGHSLRPIDERDACALRLPCVIVKYVGKGPAKRVKSVCLASLDVGQVTDSYAEAWVRSETPIYGEGEQNSYAIRFERSSHRVYAIDGKGKQNG